MVTTVAPNPLNQEEVIGIEGQQAFRISQGHGRGAPLNTLESRCQSRAQRNDTRSKGNVPIT